MPRARRAVLAVSLFVAAGLAAAAGSGRAGVGGTWLPAADGVLSLLGFGIDMVVLSGNRNTDDRDIYDALDLPNARSLASFDAQGVRRRLERLPWVAGAEITRVFPGRLDVRITERKAFAIWSRNGRDYLIDATGHVLSPISGAASLSLPRVVGEGAAPFAAELVSTVSRHPELVDRVVAAERVGERRWTLRLANGSRLVLPPDREGSVLEALGGDGRLARLLSLSPSIIDLRTPGRIAIRPADAIAAPARPAGT